MKDEVSVQFFASTAQLLNNSTVLRSTAYPHRSRWCVFRPPTPTPRAPTPLLVLLLIILTRRHCSSRRRFLRLDHFERPKQRREIDHFIRGGSEEVPEILRNRRHFHPDTAPSQLDRQISEIGVPGYKNHHIGFHFD